MLQRMFSISALSASVGAASVSAFSLSIFSSSSSSSSLYSSMSSSMSTSKSTSSTSTAGASTGALAIASRRTCVSVTAPFAPDTAPKLEACSAASGSSRWPTRKCRADCSSCA
eukprot:3187691-Pyramimonas_sp.AAC.1